MEWGKQRPLPPAHTSAASPEPHRSLTVDNNVIYGEAPVRLRRGPREGRVQGWGNRGQQARLFGAPSGVGEVAETRGTGPGREPGHRLYSDHTSATGGGSVRLGRDTTGGSKLIGRTATVATQRPHSPPPTAPGWFSGKLPCCRSGSFGSCAFGADPLASCNGPTFSQAPRSECGPWPCSRAAPWPGQVRISSHLFSFSIV